MYALNCLFCLYSATCMVMLLFCSHVMFWMLWQRVFDLIFYYFKYNNSLLLIVLPSVSSNKPLLPYNYFLFLYLWLGYSPLQIVNSYFLHNMQGRKCSRILFLRTNFEVLLYTFSHDSGRVFWPSSLNLEKNIL